MRAERPGALGERPEALRVAALACACLALRDDRQAFVSRDCDPGDRRHPQSDLGVALHGLEVVAFDDGLDGDPQRARSRR